MSNLYTVASLNFQLRNRIGAGGEAEVYEAFDPQLNAIFATKKIPLAKFNNIDEFFEESRKLYLTRHHNVVKVNYACNNSNFVYLSMPLYKNGSVKSLMDKRFLTSREIIRYSLQFLSGLNNIHSKGLIHFDIKPENFLLSDSNQALISDFGLAQYTSQYGFSRNFGTTRVFAPPELFVQPEHNLKFDIYQAGLSIYRMCNGDKVFEKQFVEGRKSRGIEDDKNLIEKIKNGKFPDRSFYFPHIPTSLRNVVRKAMEIDPNHRYDSIIDMLNDLSKIETANDWQFINNGDEELWINGIYEVSAKFNGSSWNTSASKDGRRKLDFCKNNLTDSQKSQLLYKCLNTSW